MEPVMVLRGVPFEDAKRPTHVLILSMDPQPEVWERESSGSYIQRERALLARFDPEGGLGVPVPEGA